MMIIYKILNTVSKTQTLRNNPALQQPLSFDESGFLFPPILSANHLSYLFLSAETRIRQKHLRKILLNDNTFLSCFLI